MIVAELLVPNLKSHLYFSDYKAHNGPLWLNGYF